MLTVLRTKIIISVLVVLGIIGGGLLASKSWNLSWNPFLTQKETKTDIIAQAFRSLGEKKSLASGIFIRAEINKAENIEGSDLKERPQSLGIEISLLSKTDNSDPKNPKSDVNFQTKLKSEGMEISLAGETRKIAEDFYFRITELPAFISAIGNLGEIKNQWYYYNQTQQEQEKQLKLSPEETKKLTKEIGDLLQRIQPLEIKENLGSEDLEQERATHYKISFRKEGLKTFVPEFLNIVERYFPEKEKQNFFKEKQEFLKVFNEKFEEFWSQIEKAVFDLWVGERSGTVRKIEWKTSLDLSQAKTEEFDYLKKQIGEGIVDFSVKITFSQFNKFFKIEKPENVKPGEQLTKLFSEISLPIGTSTPVQ